MTRVPQPLIAMDIPDPDVIRVGDTFYMITTTMHFFPGAQILQSHDLLHWEHASYVFEQLDSPATAGQRLENGHTIYGQGMWAGSLRHHNGIFHVVFSANDTHRTYHFTAEHITGPWIIQPLEGFYYDCSLFFDIDDRAYLVHGNHTIRLTELNDTLTAPRPGGLDRILLEDDANAVTLGFEGSHLYRIDGRYYLFNIHWPKAAPARRTQTCAIADSLDGTFTVRDVFSDDMGYHNSGIAQGGIVDDLDGNWYAILFQDHGAFGRMPVLLPVTFGDDHYPILGVNGTVPSQFPTPSVANGHSVHTPRPLAHDDDFRWTRDDHEQPQPDPQWQWNHMPDASAWSIVSPSDAGNALRLYAATPAPTILRAHNTLTIRTTYPHCRVEITIDPRHMQHGEQAGLVALLAAYATVEVYRDAYGKLGVRMTSRAAQDDTMAPMPTDNEEASVLQAMNIDEQPVRLALEFTSDDTVEAVAGLYYDETRRQWHSLGTHRLYWKLDHFTGCRAGVFMYGSTPSHGYADFSDFRYLTD